MKRRNMVIFMLMAALLLGLTGSASAFGAAGDEAEYKIQGYDNNTGDYIVAKYNVKDYGAKGDGVSDDTAAFTKLFSELRRDTTKNGAVVYLPAGRYKITRNLVVPAGVHLRGQWNNPALGGTGEETVLLACVDALDEEWTTEAPPQGFLNLGSHATVSDLVVYYPEQSADNIQIYPYTVQADTHNVNVKNLTLVNSYFGVNVGTKDKGSSHVVKNVFGTVLRRGVNIDYNYSDGVVLGLEFSSDYWRKYADLSDAQVAKVKAFTKANATALYIGKSDDYVVCGVDCDVDEYKEVFSVNHNANVNDTATGTPPFGYGVAMNLNGAATVMNKPADYNENKSFPMPMDVDGVKGAEKYGYEQAPARFATKAKLFNVVDYGAVADGETDCTFALAAALEDAGKNGGGIVYLPEGNYVVSAPLTLPENVELLGESQDVWMGEATRIEINWGRNLPDAAFLTLSAGSGVQGISFRTVGLYQETVKQTLTTGVESVPRYAWVIRGAGKNVWVENVEFYNVMRGIDFSSAACDNFVINGVYGTALEEGAWIGGGTKGGRIENFQMSYSLWFEGEGRQLTFNEFISYTSDRMNGLTFGNCSDIVAFNIGGFGLKNSVVFRAENGKAPTNMVFYKILADSPYGHNGVLVEAGDALTMLGLSTGVNTKQYEGHAVGTLMNVAESFSGKLRVFVQNTWSSATNKIAEGRDVEIYEEGEQDTDPLEQTIVLAPFPGLDDHPDGPTPVPPTTPVDRNRTVLYTILFSAAALVIVGIVLAVLWVKKKRA